MRNVNKKRRASLLRSETCLAAKLLDGLDARLREEHLHARFLELALDVIELVWRIVRRERNRVLVIELVRHRLGRARRTHGIGAEFVRELCKKLLFLLLLKILFLLRILFLQLNKLRILL